MKNPSGIKAFGTHLRKLEEERKISQQELVYVADVAKITIQGIENAKYNVTIDVLVSLSSGLNIPLKEFMNFGIPASKDIL